MKNGNNNSLVVSITALVIALVGNFVTFQAKASTIKRICVKTEINKAILHQEHTSKLEQTQTELQVSEQYLRDHPNGAPGIPKRLITHNITEKKKEIIREIRIINQTKPDRC